MEDDDQKAAILHQLVRKDKKELQGEGLKREKRIT
jgi:hypothetical protein